MPFYCGERSACICVVLGQKKSSTYCSEDTSSFFEPAPLICPRLLRLAKKDSSDRLLARIIHDGFYSNRRHAAVTSLAAGSP